MKLFEPASIGRLSLKNRIIMAPMGNRLDELDGRLSQRGIDYFVARARGGTGLIMTGGFSVARNCDGPIMSLDYPMIDHRMYVTRLNELALAIHDYGARVSIQLLVAGGRTARPGVYGGSNAAPSAMPCFWNRSVTTREITIDEIKRLLQAFQLAAEIARDAGIDSISLHGHKGAFFDQFMTSLWNRRADDYGGSLDNRVRLAVEVLDAIQRGAGTDFPVIYRYGLTHYLDGGRDIEEGLEIARRLEAAGFDALLIDAGCEETVQWIHPPTTMPPGCMVNLAARVKQVVRIPVIAVGKLGYPELAERVLQEGKADFIALGRPLLADPEWPNKVKGGCVEDIRPCIGDNEGCEARLANRLYLSCTVNPSTGMEKEFALEPAEEMRTVLVIGGGPAGMEAARVAALRGHKVTLWEKANALGGNLITASTPDFKQDYRRLVEYLIAQLRKGGVRVELGKEGTPELILEMQPDIVFVATGGTPIIPAIPGVDRANVLTAVDVLHGKQMVGKLVVVIGGGVAGSEAALYLAQGGKQVTVVEILDTVAQGIYHRDNRIHLLELLSQAKVKILTQTSVLEIAEGGVRVVDRDGVTTTLPAETVVLAVGFRPNDELCKALATKLPEVHCVGDCLAPRKVIDAIWEAFRTARRV